ncbi:hypothetical protein Tco_0378520, partial [Tanacetum coccineum]
MGPAFIMIKPDGVQRDQAVERRKKIGLWFREGVSSESAVVDSLVVAIPLPVGSGHSLETLDVEYEWRPPRCATCKIFDHEDECCLTWDKKDTPSPLSGDICLRDVGSNDVQVKRKKKSVNQAA